MFPEPLRVPHEPILVIFPTGNGVFAGRVDDYESEYEEDDSGDYECGVAEEVKGQ